MLLSDSLGGTAKTLMFVNISPADYNLEESNMSLMYASRVKLITNDVKKNVESKALAKARVELVNALGGVRHAQAVYEKKGISLEDIEESLRRVSTIKVPIVEEEEEDEEEGEEEEEEREEDLSGAGSEYDEF
eukprot:CAMPEP_0201281588 /NCGR_PEP_ID=MMETSP1317-20130820/3421_1 /ASSEMBLY_ACC=CAM_ASM_000770 /TAXON_ID=187299 /ORGANISM="Undescribed Undescribed, Strain Undescribed" /LENGTH=132 /DNA_ID=CAMNT_0047591839 /DNA_START=2235 /DNA_END=2633 /DNA_ORIENTATION=-